MNVQECFQTAARVEILLHDLYAGLARCFRTNARLHESFLGLADEEEQPALRIRLLALHRKGVRMGPDGRSADPVVRGFFSSLARQDAHHERLLEQALGLARLDTRAVPWKGTPSFAHAFPAAHLPERHEPMKRLLVAALLASLAGSASADAAATFKAKCAMCHGQDGAGGAMYKASIKGTKEADVLKAINDGKGKMKPVKIDDAAAVAKYVSGLK
jgi:cytochrome c553